MGLDSNDGPGAAIPKGAGDFFPVPTKPAPPPKGGLPPFGNPKGGEAKGTKAPPPPPVKKP